jgi:integrase
LRAAADGLLEVDESTTVGEFLVKTWLPAIEGRNLSPTTLDTYQRLTRKHLVKHLGAIPLVKFRTAHVEKMIGALEGLSPKSRRNVHGVLSAALEDAKRWELVKTNVARGAKLPQLDEAPPKAWALSDLALFSDAVIGERLAPVWQFLAMTGCRRGEAAGVRWSDVDLERGLVTFVNERVIAGGTVIEKTPKTRSGARTITIDDELVSMLRTLKAEQRVELMRLGVRNAGGYVFTAENGRPYWPQRITADFRQVTDRLGLPRIGPHGLRHTSVTWAMASGQNPKVVAQRHGHTDASFTMKRYSHVLPGHDRAAANAYAQALRDERERNGYHAVTTEPDSAT